MPSEAVQDRWPSAAFWVLAIFLALVFVTGGSSRPDVASSIVLRPVACLVTGYGLFTINIRELAAHKFLIVIFAMTILLVVAHVVPLPASWWMALPGRDILIQIDRMSAHPGAARPLSMVPGATWNALYSLSIPAAVLTLTCQLSPSDNRRLVTVLIALIGLSGVVGLLQAIGMDIQFYSLHAETPGLFANRNHQGVLLAMLIPLVAVATAVGSFSNMNRRTVGIIAILIVVIVFPLIIVTGSRAGLVAAGLAVLLVPLLRLHPRSREKRDRRVIAAQAGFGLLVLGGLAALTVFSARDVAIGRMERAGEDGRYAVWGSIVDAAATYFPWGTGIGSYADVYQISEPANLLRTTFSNHAHNEWLEIVFTAGLPGILILVAGIWFLAAALLRSMRSTGSDARLARLGLALIIILAFGSTIDYPARTPIMAAVLIIAAAWASSFKRLKNEAGDD